MPRVTCRRRACECTVVVAVLIINSNGVPSQRRVERFAVGETLSERGIVFPHECSFTPPCDARP